MKAAESRRDDLLGGHAGRVDAQRTGGPSGRRHGFGDRSVQLLNHRRDAFVEPRARFRRRDAARGAMEQANTKAGLELPDRLAQRGRRETQMAGRARKAAALDDRSEGFQLGENRSAHSIWVSKRPIQFLGDFLINWNRDLGLYGARDSRG